MKTVLLPLLTVTLACACDGQVQFDYVGMSGYTCYTSPGGISADGVVGVSTFGGCLSPFSFRWTPGVGTSFLQTPPGSNGNVAASVLSADGTTRVGSAQYGNRLHAIRWVGVVGEDLGLLPGGTQTVAQAVSADGSVIAGLGDDARPYHGFRWHNGVFESLYASDSNQDRVQAIGGISADGTVVVGSASFRVNGNNVNRAVFWTTGPNAVQIPAAGGVTPTNALCISPDGRYIGGVGTVSSGNTRGYVYDRVAGTTRIFPPFPGEVNSSVVGLAEHAEEIIGFSDNNTLATTRSWMQTERHAMFALMPYFLSNGVQSVEQIKSMGNIPFRKIYRRHRMDRFVGCVAGIDLLSDIDGDGFVTGADFDSFVAAFELGTADADYNNDGWITGIDFDDFVTEFEQGC